MSIGTAVFLFLLGVAIGAGVWFGWNWYSRRKKLASVVSGELIELGHAALKAEQEKSDDEAAETMRRNAAKRRLVKP